MRHVFAQADVADQQHFGDRALDGTGSPLHDSVFFPRAGGGFVLFFRQTEQDDGGNTQRARFVGFLYRFIDRQIENAGHGAHFFAHAFAGANKERIDKVLGSEPSLAHHVAQGRGAAQAAQTCSREGHAQILAGAGWDFPQFQLAATCARTTGFERRNSCI